jgi:predicted transcriptional regulator
MMVMEGRNFNELKLQVLTLLKNREGLTSHDIHSSIDGELTNVCDVLCRLNRQRLVDRHPLPRERPGRPRFAYSISKRGRHRLEYWESKTKEGGD